MKNISYILFSLLFIWSCNSEKQQVAPEGIISEETVEELKIFPDTVKERNEELNYDVYILYPEYNNYDQDGLRKMSRGYLFNQKTQFQKFIKDFDAISTRSMKGEYIVRHQDKNLLSMILKADWEVPGTSRIIHNQRTLNWDLNKKRFLYERDFFIKENAYEAFKEIVNRKEKEKCEFPPKREDYTFTFSKEEGVFLNPITSLNPPECYHLSVIIPWEELESVLTEEGKKFYKD